MIQKDDMTFVPLNTIFKSLDQNWLEEQDMSTINDITDGMTNVFLTKDKYELRMFFYTFVHPKPQGKQESASCGCFAEKVNLDSNYL
jgi:hypothetical protein